MASRSASGASRLISSFACLLGVTLLVPAPALGQEDDCNCNDGGTVLEMTGLVRDFKERTVPGGHTDFERELTYGPGLYTGNVDVFLHERRPVFTGGGHRVTDQAHDAGGNPIAPHLVNRRFLPGVDQPPQATVAVLHDSRGVDAFEITFVSAEFNEDGTSTWQYHVRELDHGQDLSHWQLRLEPTHQVMPGTTPGYDYGVDGSTGLWGIKWDVTDGFTEETFTIVLDRHYLGADSTCSVVAKGGRKPDLGDLFAPTPILSPTGSPFNPGPGIIDDPTLGDTPAVLSVQSNGGIESAASFRKWFMDDPPINMSTMKTIRLVRELDSCTFTFDDAEDPAFQPLGGFFPVDGDLFGYSEGTPHHNYHFTFHVRARFTYDQSSGQFFRFTGDDDVWVFVDDKLAIDLGGIHEPLTQHVGMARMGLVDGETYEIDMFFAERHRTQSNVRVETNICLECIEPELVSAVFD